MQSLDVIGSNIDKIAKLFPQCVIEHKDKDGKTVLGIDFEKLRDELSADVIDEGEERYQFTWPDKKAHAHLANTPTTKTLRPCREESVDFDHTQNLYIEGDNLDVLKVIRETYLGKVKMIYIAHLIIRVTTLFTTTTLPKMPTNIKKTVGSLMKRETVWFRTQNQTGDFTRIGST